MATIEAKIFAHLPDHNDPETLLGSDHRAAINALYFTLHSDMSGAGWAYVGEASISVELPDKNALIESKVTSLKAQQTKILADAQAEHTNLERKIQTLLAITFDGSANEAPDDQPGYGVDAAGTFEG